MRRVLAFWWSDVVAWYPHNRLARRLLGALTNPSLMAALLVRCCQFSPYTLYWVARFILVTNFSCDVSRGVTIGRGLKLPHPIGIVIGLGVRIAENVTIYQHVTLGSLRDNYPTVQSGVIIFPAAIVVGAIELGEGCVIGARTYVDHSVPARAVFNGT